MPAIHQHGEQRRPALAGRFLEQIINLHHVAAGAARDEIIKENTDEQQRIQPLPAQRDSLHIEQQPPAHGGDQLHRAVREKAGEQPPMIRAAQHLEHFRALLRIAQDEEKDRQREGDLERGEESFFQRSSCAAVPRLTRRISESTCPSPS